ncbi:MAG: DUF2007 domain-containing protein [Fibrobacteres bacterium]|jgi:hypothetical protein|nr:DUF2007 domain-containing protein [Fibrobacterota bacterium]
MSLVPVYKASSSTQAIIICNLLKEGGIEAQVRTDDANGLFPSIDLTDGVDVMVDDAQVGEANALLEEFRSGATALDDDAEV